MESAVILAALRLTTSLAIISPPLSISRGLPQALRIHKAGTEGVSVGTWICSLIVSELWLSYGILFHVPAEIATHIPNLTMSALVVVAVARHRSSLRKDLKFIAAATFAVICLVCISQFTQTHFVLSVPAVTASVVFFLPQMLKALREDDLLGVSIVTWLLALAAAISWGIYGLLIHQPAIALPSVVMIPASIVIVLRVLHLRRHEIEPAASLVS